MVVPKRHFGRQSHNVTFGRQSHNVTFGRQSHNVTSPRQSHNVTSPRQSHNDTSHVSPTTSPPTSVPQRHLGTSVPQRHLGTSVSQFGFSVTNQSQSQTGQYQVSKINEIILSNKYCCTLTQHRLFIPRKRITTGRTGLAIIPAVTFLHVIMAEWALRNRPVGGWVGGGAGVELQ